MSKKISLFKASANKKYYAALKIIAVITFAVTIAVCTFMTTYSKEVDSGLSDNIIRLHVIANSDSPEDQELKRQVRDVIIDEVKVMLDGSKNIDETQHIISNKLDVIKSIAQSEIKSRGKDYEAHIMLGNFPFPTKMYGDITLPAGNYKALRVVIGNGEGENWWCVLFPPLCFVDATHGTIPDSLKQDLKDVLSEEDYKIITSNDPDEDIPIKIKFKIVEIFQNSKSKVLTRISRMFN